MTTNQELNTLVAMHVMDWGGIEKAWYGEDGDRRWMSDWNPSTSIANAMEVMERIRESMHVRWYNSGKVEVILGDPESGPCWGRMESDSIAQGICIAALEMKGVEVPA